VAPWRQKAETALKGVKLEPDYPMALLTTFKIGGPVDLLAEPANPEQLRRVIDFCETEHLPWFVVGLGSNLLVRDKGVRGVAVKLGGEFGHFEVTGRQISAGAAVPLAELAKATAELGLAGLEFACGIPGSVGGAVYMNAGAYDGEIAQAVLRVQVFDSVAGLIWYDRAALQFGYRHSRLQVGNLIAVKVLLELQPGEPAAIAARIADLTQRRECKQPLDLPSAGSVFRRPEGYYVGPLLEEAGLKGCRVGGAQISTKHAGFIINAGGATARDVLDLIQQVRMVIQARYGADLVPELKVIGEE
jgi:UDP-N-acetylmuramate dehydrogenase